MKQHVEMVVKVRNIKEIRTRSGKWLYNFSVPISKMTGDAQLTEWLQVSILQDTQRLDLKDVGEVHFSGQLVVREAYKEYPQSISIFGFYIEPILGQVYRQRKAKSNNQPTQQDAQPRETASAIHEHQESGQGYQSAFHAMSEDIPFMRISDAE